MRFELKEAVGGVTLRQVRDLLRRFDMVSVASVERFCEMGAVEAGRLLEALAAAGYLEIEPTATEASGIEWYQPTDLGMRLRKAKAYKRILRAKAVEILGRLKETIELINADDALVYHVEDIYVFGSVLNGGEDIGDVDVAFRLGIRPPYAGRVVEAGLARARAAGKTSLSFLERVGWGQIEVRRLLAKSSRMIDLHDISAIAILDPAPDMALFYSCQGGFVADWDQKRRIVEAPDGGEGAAIRPSASNEAAIN